MVPMCQCSVELGIVPSVVDLTSGEHCLSIDESVPVAPPLRSGLVWAVSDSALGRLQPVMFGRGAARINVQSERTMCAPTSQDFIPS